MENVFGHTGDIASALILFVCIYFLFMLGVRLANDDLGNNTFFAWGMVAFMTFAGYAFLKDNKPLGYLGFISVLTYILLKMFRGVNFDIDTKNKAKGIVFSGIASAITYVVTNTVFGFGIPEASIAAILAAGLLGMAGYSA